MSDPLSHPPATGGSHHDPGIRSTVVVGLVGLLLTAATVVGLQALHESAAEGERARKAAALPAEAKQARREQAERLEGYRVDPASGRISIPIERAMELVVEEARAEGAGREEP